MPFVPASDKDRAYILIDGSLFTSGKSEEVAANPDVLKFYLGENFRLERYVPKDL
ncbi:MAG: hypothetical protein WC121_00525 [Candidatus Kapaibacterium sp.]|jgi:ABC-type lipopolysaccharide export system ATPase subunit